MTINDFPLGDIPLDSQQTLRKTYDETQIAHRVSKVNLQYDRIEYVYNDNGQIESVCYVHDIDSEITKVKFTADESADLELSHFILYSTKNENAYRIHYIVDNASADKIDIDTIKYVNVHIKENDPASVVALATKLAMDASTSFSADFTITEISSSELQFETEGKGETDDVFDVGTNFEFEIIQDGLTTTEEKLTYAYDEEGNLISIDNLDSQNI
jgi:hypothetical protein